MSAQNAGQDDGYPLGGYASGIYQEPHRASLILALAVAGFFFACGMTCPLAWWMGRADLQKMQAGTMDPSGRSLTQAGHIFGVVGTVLVVVPAFLTMALVALYFLAILVLGIAGVTLGA